MSVDVYAEIIINSANMYLVNLYLVNLLPKRFRLSASSENYQQKILKTKLQYLHFTKTIGIEKRDDSKRLN